MRKFIKKLVLNIITVTGLVRLFQFLYRKQIAVLMIHGVMDDRDKSEWKPLMSKLSREKLEGYLRILSKKYNFISLSEAVEILQGKKPVKPYSIVVTFDDGYRNNFTCALPILRKYNIPATFYVPTSFLDNPEPFWWDRLDYAIQQISFDRREIKFGTVNLSIENGDREKLGESFRKFRRAAKDLNMSDHDFLMEIERLTVQLEQESGRSLVDFTNDDEWSAVVTWDRIAANNNDDVIIGSHTKNHIRLGLVEREAAIDQLTQSKQEIEARTGKPCFSVAYPNGSLNNETAELAKKCGYICGVTTEEGFNKVSDDLMTLNRINVPTDMDNAEFLSLISGVSYMLHPIKEFLLYPIKLFNKYFRAIVDRFLLFRSHGIKTVLKRISSE